MKRYRFPAPWIAKGIAVPFDRSRAPALLPHPSLAAAPRLKRHEAQALTRISVLAPVRNCRADIRCRLRAWLDKLDGRDAEIVVVDDASTDGTWEAVAALAAEDSRIRPIRFGRRQGFGQALCTAVRQMRGDVAIVTSSAAQAAETSLDAWLRPIRGGTADAVLGAPSASGPRTVSSPRPSLSKRLATACLNACFALSLSAGWRLPIAVRSDVLRHLRLTSRGDGVTAELIGRLAQWGATIRETPMESDCSSAVGGAWRSVVSTLRCRFWDPQFTSHTGFYVLTAVAHADRYSRWIVNQVRPYVGRRVLEAGAGIGNLSQLFGDCDRLLLVDHEEVYLDRLEQRFAHDARVRVLSVDLTTPAEVESCATERIDTVFCSNVLEHLEPDEQVLKSFADALQPGGHCVLVVPAGERLYTGIDAALGHFRRYEPAALQRKLEAAGMEVVFSRRFSRLGTIGWAVSGHLFRRRALSPRQMIWFDRLLPVAKLLEYVLPVPGMSLIMVGRKPARPAQLLRRAA